MSAHLHGMPASGFSSAQQKMAYEFMLIPWPHVHVGQCEEVKSPYVMVQVQCLL